MTQKHTVGPWEWRKFGHGLALCTVGRGAIIVMDFVRKGMHGAQPRFGIRSESDKGGLLRTADEIDIEAHPDARLLKASPVLLDAARAAADLLLRCDSERMPNDLTPATDEDWDRVVGQLNEAIALAEPLQPACA